MSPEQQKVFDELNDIMDKFEREGDSESHREKKEQIITFIHDMEGSNFSPNDFVLGKRLMGEKMVKAEENFDTPDHDIENFIRSMKE